MAAGRRSLLARIRRRANTRSVRSQTANPRPEGDHRRRDQVGLHRSAVVHRAGQFVLSRAGPALAHDPRMVSAISSRAPQIAVALAVVVLAPLTVLGAVRLLDPVAGSAVATGAPVQAVTEIVVLPQPVRAESEPGGMDLPATLATTEQPPPRWYPSPAASSPDVPRLEVASAAPSATLSGSASADPLATMLQPVPSSPPQLPPVPCGPSTMCAPGDVCCNPTCGICAAAGEACSRQDCGFASVPSSAPCGANTCNVGQVCCNSSCGICTAPGVGCSQKRCDDGPVVPFSQACGMRTCDVESVCCDATCGLCATVADCVRLHC